MSLEISFGIIMHGGEFLHTAKDLGGVFRGKLSGPYEVPMKQLGLHCDSGRAVKDIRRSDQWF